VGVDARSALKHDETALVAHTDSDAGARLEEVERPPADQHLDALAPLDAEHELVARLLEAGHDDRRLRVGGDEAQRPVEGIGAAHAAEWAAQWAAQGRAHGAHSGERGPGTLRAMPAR